MSTRSWIRNLFARAPRTVHKDAPRFRPMLEGLETREVPAIITVTTLADYEIGVPHTGVTLRDAIRAASTDTSVYNGPRKRYHR